MLITEIFLDFQTYFYVQKQLKWHITDVYKKRVLIYYFIYVCEAVFFVILVSIIIFVFSLTFPLDVVYNKCVVFFL